MRTLKPAEAEFIRECIGTPDLSDYEEPSDDDFALGESLLNRGYLAVTEIEDDDIIYEFYVTTSYGILALRCYDMSRLALVAA